MSTQQLVESLYRGGNLRHLLQEHQLLDYDDFRRWNEDRQTLDHRQWVKESGALYDNLWVDECGRRFGKTARDLILDVEEACMRPGARGLIATPLRKSIGGIIVPLTKLLFKDAPEGYFPHYLGTHGADHECLYIEATDSIIKLVGLDKHPDATRGQFLDFCHITEAAFVKGLYELVTAVIMPQFRYRPHAWLAMETSTAKVVDCDFNQHFRADAETRGTYRMRTIRDNVSLTEDDIEQEERRSGGRDSAVCQRELYCISTRDPDDMIVPEFDEAVHVVEHWPIPAYAMAHEGLDPGTTDPFGMVGGFLDWMQQCLVIQWGWHKSNASTGEIVAMLQFFESLFWGTQHASSPEILLARRPGRELSIADALRNGDDKVWEAPPKALTYWDEGSWSLKANPASRISDIQTRVLLDLNVDHKLDVRPARKGPGSAEADLSHLRELFRARPRRIAIVKNEYTAGLIAQLRSGEWDTDENGHRTDWKRSKTLGHCDELASLKYMARDVNWQRCPNKPAVVDVNAIDTHVPHTLRERVQGVKQQAFGGRGAHSFDPRGVRQGR